jgi:transposase InsO family protein
MNNETREQIALARFKIISPVLAEPGRVRNEYFRTQAAAEHDIPHVGPRRYSPSTFKAWLKSYRARGFEGLKPKTRTDCGAPRRITDDLLAHLRARCQAAPDLSATLIHEELARTGLLGNPPACYNTLLRTLKREGLLTRPRRTDARMRFETADVNDLWMCDFMHGPQAVVEGRPRKAILCAIIDDHSRMIVGWAFNVHETVSLLTVVLKQAFLAFGLPKRFYVDNGAAFSADLLLKSCAQAGISLTHSKPYDAPSRGKIERFFRTVRERFLSGLGQLPAIDELNQAFSLWLTEDYHHKLHTGIDQRPIDRYHASAARTDIRRLSAQELDHIFLVRHERVVNHDATISFKGALYEVPAAYIRQRIEIRHPVDDPEDLVLYDNGKRVAALKLLDARENARTFRPAADASPISFAKGKVTP